MFHIEAKVIAVFSLRESKTCETTRDDESSNNKIIKYNQIS